MARGAVFIVDAFSPEFQRHIHVLNESVVPVTRYMFPRRVKCMNISMVTLWGNSDLTLSGRPTKTSSMDVWDMNDVI